MFIGHLPAGYLLGRALRRRLGLSAWFGWELVGSVFPDIDLLWFYTLGHHKTLHHKYFTHLPWYWVLVSLAWYTLWRLSRNDTLRQVGWLFLPNVFCHLFLDTIVGKIDWLAPFSDESVAFFDVPARYHPYILNYLLHWTFGFEVLIVAWAAWVFRASRASSHSPQIPSSAGP